MDYLLGQWQPKSSGCQSSEWGIGSAAAVRSIGGSILAVELESLIACSRKDSGLFTDCCLEQLAAVVGLVIARPTTVELAIAEQ